MPAAVLFAGALTILFGERLTVHDGLGWDGQLYASWVKDFYNVVVVHGLPEYYTRRILPSLIVRLGMCLFSVPLENGNIVRAFQLYDLALLALSAYVWGLAADEMGIRDRGKWFGFLFLFVNFAEWKCTFFISIWTDTTAFAMGLLLLYLYLKDNAYGMALVLFLSAFVWPTAPFVGALLFVFPRPKTPYGPGGGLPYGLSSVLAALFALTTLAALLFLTNGDLDDRRLFVNLTLRSLSWRRVAVTGLILALTKLIQFSIWDGTDISVGSIRAFGIQTLLTSLPEPLVFLVAHVIYFGPAVLLMALFWKRLCLPYSKVWYQINSEPLVFDGTMDCLLRFPMQRLFMNLGPYMSRPAYLIQGAAVALTAITFYYFYKVRARPVSPSSNHSSK